MDQGKFTARRPPAPQFTRSGLTRTYLPAVARPLSCVVWVGEGQDVEMAKLRVAEASAPWRRASRLSCWFTFLRSSRQTERLRLKGGP